MFPGARARTIARRMMLVGRLADLCLGTHHVSVHACVLTSLHRGLEVLSTLFVLGSVKPLSRTRNRKMEESQHVVQRCNMVRTMLQHVVLTVLRAATARWKKTNRRRRRSAPLVEWLPMTAKD
jgi:hypothetical protein